MAVLGNEVYVRFQRKRNLTPRDFGILGLIALVVIVICSLLIGTNVGLARRIQGGGGFFVAREGAQAFLFEHTEPYSGTVANLTQQLVYGRIATTNEDPYFLTIPFFLIPFYFPFALFSDNATAFGLWMFLNEIVLIGTALLCFKVIGWHPRPIFIIIFSISSIFSFYSLQALIDGTPVIVLGLLYLAIIFAYSSGSDEIAGLLLVFTLFYWEVGCLFILVIVWKIFSDRRWRVLYGFGMAFVILGTLSLLIYPGWVYPFVIAVLANIRAQFGITSSMIFADLDPAYGNIIARTVAFFVIIVLIIECNAIRGSDMRRFIWAACLALALTPLFGFRTELSNLVVLFPSLAIIFAATTDRWRAGYLFTSILFAIFFLVPWFLFGYWYSLHDQRYYDVLFLFCPVFTIVGLYWSRWWFIRAPRTWLDQMRSSV